MYLKKGRNKIKFERSEYYITEVLKKTDPQKNIYMSVCEVRRKTTLLSPVPNKRTKKLPGYFSKVLTELLRIIHVPLGD